MNHAHPDHPAHPRSVPLTVKGKPNTPELRAKDLKTLALFVELFCRNHHADQTPFTLKGFDINALAGKEIRLCPDCAKLLAHALVKRTACPLDPKPMCKHCPTHCYAPHYRTRIQEVMRYSGKALLLRGRLDYLLHLLF